MTKDQAFQIELAVMRTEARMFDLRANDLNYPINHRRAYKKMARLISSEAQILEDWKKANKSR